MNISWNSLPTPRDALTGVPELLTLNALHRPFGLFFLFGGGGYLRRAGTSEVLLHGACKVWVVDVLPRLQPGKGVAFLHSSQ